MGLATACMHLSILVPMAWNWAQHLHVCRLLAIMGPSGGGKTSLLNALAGQVHGRHCHLSILQAALTGKLLAWLRQCCRAGACYEGHAAARQPQPQRRAARGERRAAGVRAAGGHVLCAADRQVTPSVISFPMPHACHAHAMWGVQIETTSVRSPKPLQEL